MGRVPAGTGGAQICNFTTGTSKFMDKGLRRAGLSHVPVVLIISDFEGVGAHSWIESRGDNVICGTSLCRQQALNMGIPPDQARTRRPGSVGHRAQVSGSAGR